MTRYPVIWLIVVAAVIVSCFAVPFIFLNNVDTWYGSALFWILAAASVIVINAVVSKNWKD